MTKEKFGKKDIFTPLAKAEKEKVKKTKEHIPSESSSRMVIHSFRMREDLVERLREYAFFEKTKIYKAINQAVEEFLKTHKTGKRTLSS